MSILAHQHRRTNATDFMESNHGSHPYVQTFLNMDFVKENRYKKEYRSMFNHNHIAKEVTEAIAVLRRISNVVKRVRRQYEYLSDDEFQKRLTFLDLCSGKGFVSSVLASQYPQARVLMLDKDTHMNITHIDIFPNVTFRRAVLQIHARRGHSLEHDADAIIARDIEQHSIDHNSSSSSSLTSSIYIAVGMHLCSRLSERLIEIYNRHPEIRGLVLSPCCIRLDAVRPVRNMETSVMSEYQYWTFYLYMSVNGVRNIDTDEKMLSNRNNFIVAVKKEENEKK